MNIYRKTALTTLLLIALCCLPARADLVSHWALNEGTSDGDDVSGMVGVDETGNYPGEYKGGLFGGAESATGITGTPSTAVNFGTAGFLEILAEWDPNDPNDTGGIASRNADHFQVEFFIKWNGNPKGTPFSENITGSGGPTLLFEFTATGSSPTDIDLEISPWGEGLTASLEPTGGFDAGEWYYITANYKDPVFDDSDELTAEGLIEIFIAEDPLSETPTLYSTSMARGVTELHPRTDYLGGDVHGIERAIISAHGAGGGQTDAVIDEVKIFNQIYDPESYLVGTLGVEIPEPASLALLAGGCLLLLRRRRRTA